jgi:dUTPase
MLANQVGIIDSGYRGSLIAAFRSFQEGYTIEKHTRLVQVCHPTLKPFIVKIINENEFSETQRGSGGFGSTGN